MATWVTHLIIADRILVLFPALDRRGFCVGSIAPDCNVESADWTSFTPPRERTHWMSGARKQADDAGRFYREYVGPRLPRIRSEEEFSFLLGYWAHLIADAEMQRFIDGEARVAAAWKRALSVPDLAEKARGMERSWPALKQLIPKAERMKDIYAIEAEYLAAHPDSGYFTVILPLKSFPDYIDYLPRGAVARKVGVMGYLPKAEESAYPFVAVSREEYASYLDSAAALTEDALRGAINSRNLR